MPLTRLFYLLPLLFLFACSQVRQTPDAPEVEYINIWHSEDGPISDSVAIYKNRPFEDALALYRDADTVRKFASPEYIPAIYLEVFKIDGQKFAVLSDTASTAFYRFMPSGEIKRIMKVEVVLGIKATLHRSDLDGNGYGDVRLTMESGGSYGDDNLILFYDPGLRTLVYNDNQWLQNTTVNRATIVSHSRFLAQTFKAKNGSLRLVESEEFLQQENYGKRLIRKFTEEGMLISTDTLAAEED